MADPNRLMRLGLFLFHTGHHAAAWRHPEGVADGGLNFAHTLEIVRAVEAAKLDMVFLEDGVAVRETDLQVGSRAARSTYFEPVTLLSALAVTTTRIGLVATASSTYYEPYTVARLFGSLDQLSNGRAGWNLVTSTTDAEAMNFGRLQQDAHGDRYQRAGEFVDIVRGLWEGWAPDALRLDRETGVFFDPSRVEVLGHSGTHFSVRGPLNLPRSPQGRPVIIQAGSSEAGRDLAARTAEVVFTAQQTHEQARDFYADLKGRLGKYGRDRDDVKILPGVMIVVGDTEAQAREQFDELEQLLPIELGLSHLAKSLGFKGIVDYPLDGPLPDDIPLTAGGQSRQALMIAQAKRENMTIRQMAMKAAASRGHWQVFGSPKQVVDQLEERFTTFGCDGFNVLLPLFPRDVHTFCTKVVPELQRRGLFRTEYEGHTLRENLGLRRADEWPVQRTGAKSSGTAASPQLDQPKERLT